MIFKMAAEGAVAWSVGEVKSWLEEEGHGEFTYLFCEMHKIDGKSLLMLTENDLTHFMKIPAIGDIKRLMISLNHLKRENIEAVENFSGSDLPFGPVNNGGYFSSNFSSHMEASPRHYMKRAQRLHSDSSAVSEQADVDGSLRGSSPNKPEPEYLKLILSYIYMCFVFLLTSYVMVIVHDRVPDMEKYPPLPDLMLDNLPVIPWAFEMCELIAMVLAIIWGITLIFHKHRFIILRRMFALTGTIFLLRCITMLITSLSVPGTHFKCEPRTHEDFWTRLERTITIWRGFGMTLQGVRTCGDYMFSGHTAVVTMMNFFITEYTPRKMYVIHTATWVLNIFAIFFILAAHEHYSIDVFISFYLTSRLFLYYHSLANNRALRQSDHKRMRIWFPMFSYFEEKVDGMLPNHYEWPLRWPKSMVILFEKNKKL